jgi:hypothetical protein
MAKYLVVETTYFVDPHGTPDEGGTKKFITEKEWYAKMDTPEGMYYQGDEFVEEDDLNANEDGYNSEVYHYSVKELTPEEAKRAQDIINWYNEL